MIYDCFLSLTGLRSDSLSCQARFADIKPSYGNWELFQLVDVNSIHFEPIDGSVKFTGSCGVPGQ